MLMLVANTRTRHPLELDAPELEELITAVDDALDMTADPGRRARLRISRAMLERELANVIAEAELIARQAAADRGACALG